MRGKSIMQDNRECYITGSQTRLDVHHIYHGPRRKASDRYGCWVWLRHDIHMALHQTDPELDKRLKRECQQRFMELYGYDEFMRIFGKSYL